MNAFHTYSEWFVSLKNLSLIWRDGKLKERHLLAEKGRKQVLEGLIMNGVGLAIELNLGVVYICKSSGAARHECVAVALELRELATLSGQERDAYKA